MACRQYKDIKPVVHKLIKNHIEQKHLTEKSSFIVKLNGDNGTMVSFKILNPNDFGANLLANSSDLKTDSTETTPCYLPIDYSEKSRLFEISKDLSSKDKIEADMTNGGSNENPSNINKSQQTRKNGFTLEEKQRVLNKDSIKLNGFNSEIKDTRQESISNNNIKRTKPPSFPLHEKIYKRFQLETINDKDEGQKDNDGLELDPFGFLPKIDHNKELQVVTSDTCEEKKEKRRSDGSNGDPSVCRIYKPWLMLEPTNDDMVPQDLESEEETKEDNRYLTPDYKPTLLQDKRPEQKRKEKRIQKSIKQLVVPYNNTYSSFETKVVDGLRQVVAAKIMTDNKQDGRTLNDINNEPGDLSNDILVRCANKSALNMDNLEVRTNHQNLNDQLGKHDIPQRIIENDENERRYVNQVFERNKNSQKELEPTHQPPKNDLIGRSNHKGTFFKSIINYLLTVLLFILVFDYLKFSKSIF